MKPAFLCALGTLCLILSAPAHAALSGYYDSGAQINAIVSNPDVGNAIKQLPISRLTSKGERKDGKFEWQLKTQHCTLTVLLSAQKPHGPGRTDYKVSDLGRCR